MPKSKQTKTTVPTRKRIVFRKHQTVRLPEDVLAMLNNSTRVVDWENAQHALVAGLRRSFMKFAPDNLRVEVTPFEQLAFTPAVKVRQP
jgi:hypothetical protein